MDGGGGAVTDTERENPEAKVRRQIDAKLIATR
jgi:hypothetical protein